VVFCHDVEFVTPEEAIAAVACLFQLADEGVIRYVGISGYPHALLAELAARIRVELGRPLDAVQSYCHFNLQNSTLGRSVEKLVGRGDAGVDVVLNASPLGMGLLSGRSPGEFHPAPGKLLEACARAEEFCRGKGETLSRVAMRWVFAKWRGPTISGASYVDELEENVEAYWDALGCDGGARGRVSWGVVGGQGLEKWEPLWEGVSEILGEWRDYSWDSPPKGWGFKTETDNGL
jgi:aryl-alcohol dehydrogenase-like predicted oxidoreductase